MGERLDIPLPSGTFDLAVVLVGVSHPGNLGAICRSMLNYGFDDLRLVAPKCTTSDDETRARAKHASRVLENAREFSNIEQATKDCSAVIGTSGKRELGRKTLNRHFLYPWDMVERISNSGGTVALVFGEEGKGLSVDDLAKCDYYVTLPTWEGYPIANLSHAVTAILYEIQRSRVINHQGDEPGLPDIVPLLSTLQPSVRKSLIKAIEQLSGQTGKSPEHRLSVEQTIKRTLLKGTPSDEEATRIIGAFVEATSALEYARNDPRWQKEHRRKLR